MAFQLRFLLKGLQIYVLNVKLSVMLHWCPTEGPEAYRYPSADPYDGSFGVETSNLGLLKV